MLALKNYTFLRIIVFSLLTLAACSSLSAQDAKWKPCPPGTRLKPGDKVLVDTMRGWAEGTVVGYFGHSDLLNVQYNDPTFGSMTRPFRLEDIRIPAKPQKKKRRVPRGKAGEGENPFEAPDSFREWSDSSGKFKIEAELVETRDGDAVLKKRDGGEIAVPIDRLSKADQDYLESLESEAEDENPYASEPGVVDPDWSGAQGVMLGMNVKPDNLEPDGGPPAGPLMKRPVMLPPKGSFFEDVTGVYPAIAEDGVCAVGVSCQFPDDEAYSGIFRCDLGEKGSKIDQIEIPDKSIPLDIGPHGNLLITRSPGHMHGEASRISLWKIDGKKCVKQWDCYPYAGQGHRFNSNVSWAKFLDEEHLLTLGGGSTLTLWKLPRMKAVYSVTLKSDIRSLFRSTSRPTLSPGRKYMAVLGAGFIDVLDSRTGEVVGTYQGAGRSGSIVFRPDGKRIALTTATRVQVWEFSTGEMYRDIGFSTPYNQMADATWPAPGYILIGGRYLVDLEHHSLLWEYRPAAGTGSVATTQVIARRLWFLATQDNRRGMVPFTVPHKAVHDAIAKIKPEDTLVLQPGMKVSLEVQVEGTAEQQRKIRADFERQLKDNGFQLVSSAPVHIVARTERGQIEQKEYTEQGRMPFQKGPVHQGTFQGYISRVTLTIDGKDAWEVTSVKTAPHHIFLQGDESVAQALKRHEQVDLGFFDRIALPRYLCVPCDKVTFGATELTPAGPRPVDPTPRKRPKPQPPVVPGNRA